MKFSEAKLKGVYIIELELVKEGRGFFARSFCREEFKKHGLNFDIVQCNISYNKKKGTLRGMHYQEKPHEEIKVVTCVRGAIYDVIIDLRKNSSTFCKWIAIELSADNYTMLYIPKGFAHGFQTLIDNTVVHYQMSEFFYPELARGFRWDDPAFQIRWPGKPSLMSKKDKNHFFFKDYNEKT